MIIILCIIAHAQEVLSLDSRRDSRIAEHFEALRCRLHSSHHNWISRRSLCSSVSSSMQAISFQIFVSSANVARDERFILTGMSLMNIKKSNGPRTLPCGTPDITGRGSEV